MKFRFKRAAVEEPAPVWVDLAEPDTPTRFREAIALWAMGFTDAHPTVMLACELLVEGVDTPSLRDLAGRGFTETWSESRDLLVATFDELELEFVERGTEDAALLALRHDCRAFLNGTLTVRSFLKSADVMFSFGPPAIAQDLAYLADEYEAAAGGYGARVPSGIAERYARAFLAATA